jgi:hypothetical protein
MFIYIFYLVSTNSYSIKRLKLFIEQIDIFNICHKRFIDTNDICQLFLLNNQLIFQNLTSISIANEHEIKTINDHCTNTVSNDPLFFHKQREQARENLDQLIKQDQQRQIEFEKTIKLIKEKNTFPTKKFIFVLSIGFVIAMICRKKSKWI